MKKIVITYFLLTIIFSFSGLAQKKISIKFYSQNPKIDGKLDDWQAVDWFDDFIQLEPYNGKKASEKTLVSIFYSQDAIYVAAKVYFKKYKSLSLLTNRDDLGQADYFAFYLDPFNNGITGYAFYLTTEGVKADAKIDNTNLDFTWDAIWYGATSKNDSVVFFEFKIPFSAIKYPNHNTTWRINFYRSIQQIREIDTWNFVDNSKNGILNQMGYLQGMNNIPQNKTLFVIPHFSAIYQKYTNSPKYARSVLGGLDLKYNFNERFTLDMMLIPDFGELTSDDKILNLSPFETFYPEKRPFFTEGMEIFNKGNIFYTRRIGKTPELYGNIEDYISKNEVILKNPSQTPIINATKFSGKTSSGIGIGFLNAITAATYAIVMDTITQKIREIKTEGVINYNVLAFNFPLKNNSYFSFTNTNYANYNKDYVADVSAIEILSRDKKNTFAGFVRYSISQIYQDSTKTQIGNLIKISVKKTSGNFRFGISNDIISDTYDPNDLGYLKQNNIINYNAFIAYNIYKPFGNFLRMRNSLSFNRKFLYENYNYISTNFILSSSIVTKQNTTYGINISVSPDNTYDYFEPRVEDQFFLKPPLTNFSGYISTNYAKEFAIDLSGGFYLTKTTKLLQKQKGGWYGISPRLRLSNKVFVIYSYKYHFDKNNYGYVGQVRDSIFFGERDIYTKENTITLSYIFTKKLFLNTKIRHYWTVVDYYNYFVLLQSGQLSPLQLVYRYVKNNDLNFNVFNVDIVLSWKFAPASEISLILKKSIISSSQNLIYDYYDNFEQMYFHSPHLNNISFKILYYLDAKKFKNR